ncbi:MAG: hypothetical protein FD180_4107 [Planctomycetota bacterium]|nr:MAG: hypothetical protein FD180_4107 [Planctomycetota bacterium]
MDRREFLKLVALSGLAWKLGAGRNLAFGGDLPPNAFAGKWLGDDFRAGHVLRDRELPKFSDAEAMPEADVLVIGGGISGLVAARALARSGRTVRVLEQADVPGGNAKSAEWGGIQYSIGAAYFCAPEKDSPLETLYREIGILERAKKVPKGEVFLGGKLVEDIWEGKTDPENAEATRALRETWRRIYEERYPAVPWSEDCGWSKDEFEKLDRKPFSDYLGEIKAPPHVRTFCDHYCWSSFGGRSSEISTWCALNFLTAEFGDILALPGGNAAIARALAASLDPKVAPIDTGAFVAEIKQTDAGVVAHAICGDKPRRYAAKAAVVAVPRYVASRIIAGFPQERVDLAKAMKYRAYIVANVLLSKRPSHEWYDAYSLEALDPGTCGWTDLVLADFVAEAKTDRCVLTAYRGLPFDDGRKLLLVDQDLAHFAKPVRDGLVPLLAGLGMKESDIVDINLARWGHPLVLSSPGQLSGGAMEKLSAPLGRIAFAQQDRFGIPAIENAIEAANLAVEEIEEILK